MGGLKRALGIAALLFIAGVFVGNTNLFMPPSHGTPTILAHHGIAQRFATDDLEGEDCTASIMLPPENDYIGNTLAAMDASFAAGADIVEISVQSTKDRQLVVFHDWELGCRTEAKGETGDYTLAELKKLDVGYGYTADGGKTYPLRGKGVGLMPSLDEVFERFPDRAFFINLRSDDAGDAALLANRLARLPPDERHRLMVLADDETVDTLRHHLPSMRVVTGDGIKSCLQGYVALGWAGYVPEACHTTGVFVPIELAPWLWGFPNRFESRMASVGSKVFLIGAYHGGDFSIGIDDDDGFASIPKGYTGGVFTNELVAAVQALKPAKP